MRIYEPAQFLAEDETCQEVWAEGNTVILRQHRTLTCLDLVNHALAPRWVCSTPQPRNISGRSLGNPSAIVWSEGWSETHHECVRYLAAISMKDGKELWRHSIHTGTSGIIFGTPKWLILEKNTPYEEHKPYKKNTHLHVLHRQSGIEHTDFPSPGTPIAYVPDQEESLIVHKEGTLFELEATTGNIRWSCGVATPMRMSIAHAVATTIRVYGITESIQQKPSIFCIDRETGCLLWQTFLPLDQNSYLGLGALAVDAFDETVYVTDLAGGHHRVDSNGAVRWSLLGSETPHQGLIGSPAICRKGSTVRIFFVTENGWVRLVDPEQGRIEDEFETGQEILEASLVARKNQLQVFLPLADRVLLLEAG